MKIRWHELDVNILKMLFEKEFFKLKEALLKGIAWDDLKEQRQKVTELSIALHKKIYSSQNPAESAGRGQHRISH